MPLVVPSGKDAMSVPFGRGHSLEITFTEINREWPGAIQDFLTTQGRELEGGCFRVEMHSLDIPATKRVGRARYYYVDEGYCILGDYFLDESLRRNGLHRSLMSLRVLHCLMMGFPPEKIIWIPSLCGPRNDRKAYGFWLRPLTIGEMIATPTIIRKLALSGWWKGPKDSWRIYCVDRDRVVEMQRRALQLLGEAKIRCVPSSGESYQIPRFYSRSISTLLDLLQKIPATELCVGNTMSVSLSKELHAALQELREIARRVKS
jgi:hypothetical protein